MIAVHRVRYKRMILSSLSMKEFHTEIDKKAEKISSHALCLGFYFFIYLFIYFFFVMGIFFCATSMYDINEEGKNKYQL